jgi:hypothetical protein
MRFSTPFHAHYMRFSTPFQAHYMRFSTPSHAGVEYNEHEKK